MFCVRRSVSLENGWSRFFQEAISANGRNRHRFILFLFFFVLGGGRAGYGGLHFVGGLYLDDTFWFLLDGGTLCFLNRSRSMCFDSLVFYDWCFPGAVRVLWGVYPPLRNLMDALPELCFDCFLGVWKPRFQTYFPGQEKKHGCEQ